MEEKQLINDVVDELLKIRYTQIKPLLDQKFIIDSHAGIIIVKLEEIKPICLENGQEYFFYAARVLPSTKENPNYVKPHYHLHGIEPYHFLYGENGEMNTGIVVENEVAWDYPKIVCLGDTIEIQEGQVHSFRNKGKEPADFIFACPNEHLINHSDNPQGDRYFTTGLKNVIPSWYN